MWVISFAWNSVDARIRNWKGLKLFRPSKEEVCEHINELFSGEIDWELIQNLYPDMMRVAYVCS
ncbi:hypothetical protein CN931_08625 [Bacillus sp. AFS054943]|nr:hypothetical protein CN931_08625 [Bacillus sp. AFS054943]